MEQVICNSAHREPWNKGKLIGQKTPPKLKDIWAIRIRLQLSGHTRDLALFNLAIDSKLRACDLVKLRVRDISHGDLIAARPCARVSTDLWCSGRFLGENLTKVRELIPPLRPELGDVTNRRRSE